MSNAPNAQAEGYVLGHSERELMRLEQQAAFFADATRDGLIRAGIGPGMRVLDLGCGVGDVSLIASELVGSAGSITGIDISEGALGIARARAAATGRPADFVLSPIDAFDRFADYDAIVGRFILVHFPDPAAVIRAVVERAGAGKIIAFLEMDMSTATTSASFPLVEDNVARIAEVYRRMGLSPDMGAGLYGVFRAAGLVPQLYGATRIGNSAERAGFGFFSESVRSLAPAMEKLGIASAAEIDVDTLFDRLVAAGVSNDVAIFYPRFVSAWARC